MTAGPEVGAVEVGAALVEIDHERPTRVAIIDAGSQFLKPIDRMLREVGVDTIIYGTDVSPDDVAAECDAVVMSGGGDSVYDPDAPLSDPRFFADDYPLPGLFICFGFQQMNQARGGSVEPGQKGRYGPTQVAITDESTPFFAGFGDSAQVLMNAGDCVTAETLAPGLKVLATSTEGDHETVAAISNEAGDKIGVQFHPEVDLTVNGQELFRQFLRDVAGLELNYTAEAKRTTVHNRITGKIGNQRVVTLVSGGVDSTVLAAAIHEDLGSAQEVIHINTGAMRKGESALVCAALQGLGLRVHYVDATLDFRYAKTAYNGRETKQLIFETDPEAKRHIVGDTFARIVSATFRELGLDPTESFLAQGTLRPDLIESAGIGKNAKKIKTHHNDTPEMRQWRELGMLLEPLSDLHKDEVRELGLELGLPPEVVWRQPFPGPGGFIRVINAIQPADFVGRHEVERALKAYSDRDLGVHLLPIRSVGVQGDDRSYKHVVALSGDSDPDWELLGELASEIPKAVKEVNRVVYVTGGRIKRRRSLFTSGITPTQNQSTVMELWREADDQVNQTLRTHGLLQTISQEPVILTPVTVDEGSKDRLAVLRPFATNDFMVGSAIRPGDDKLPLDAFHDQVEAALSVDGIGRVAIDLTNKPPGTTEWE